MEPNDPTANIQTPAESGSSNTNNQTTVKDYLTGSVQATGQVTSLFNAFYVFKYSGGASLVSRALYSSLDENSTPNGDKPEIVSNPTASSIVKWASGLNERPNEFGLNNSTYSWSDFLFCKYYGIIPNNRMITLRKYPLGSQDNAAVKRGAGRVTNLPIAQAITWFGPGTPNSINDIWQNKWSLVWKKDKTDAKNVQGNEVVNFSKALTNLLPSDANPSVKAAFDFLATYGDIAATNTGSMTGDQFQAELTKVGAASIEGKMQEFQKNLYSDTGAFFNQVLGPVNVKNSFLYRDRGLSPAAPDGTWTIIFDYKTDSYFGMGQRRVGLDIMANMLALTYSDGEWLESLNIYYKNLGIALNPTEQALLEECLANGNLNSMELARVYSKIALARVDKIIGTVSQLLAEGTDLAVAGFESFAKGTSADILAKLQDSNSPQYQTIKNGIQLQLTKALAGTFPGFVQQRANVGSIATGNWHLTIGNPMNPIMRIGDLVVRDCEVTFGDELGADDFPINLSFKVTVSPTKPRDGRDIRKTFNAGRIDYTDSSLGNTTDQMNTYGLQSAQLQAESAGAVTNQAAPTPIEVTGINHATAWLNSRYGPGAVNQDYLTKVYFFQPQNADFDYEKKAQSK